ncbi:predicted protein [Sclerotinia sclerotiorum 1980 UF-70]|uniref:Uncharacterized protein n=1 Tax=Sclerotinia sclerotiorum (strain ATCC 18683 / 1980 / Ss-1) TaxID=665079 RepID=A7EXY1_SCLS1|nr:predicted protein [Sclerotinia sclerotiorum 1980 UF-70]EDN94323.1 predicted protein [Sclerotinia sclerotiorum 1980 UF-70]
MEMDLEISPHAGRSEVQSQVPTSPHFQNPMQYLHGACSHCYRDDDCLAQREMAIRASYCDRLIEMETVEFPVGTVEEAYIRGVHDGRINALSQSFEDCGVRPGEHNSSSIVDDIDEILRKLTNMGLGTAKSNEDNKIDEIVRDFNDQMMLEDDELKYEVYWHLAYMEGTKDGSYMQAQIEYKALTMDDPERSEMLRRAVL